MAKGFTYFAGAVGILILMKDGTLPTLVQRGADFIKTGASGLRPITRIA